jgi:hypothetical protein
MPADIAVGNGFIQGEAWQVGQPFVGFGALGFVTLGIISSIVMLAVLVYLEYFEPTKKNPPLLTYYSLKLGIPSLPILIQIIKMAPGVRV